MIALIDLFIILTMQKLQIMSMYLVIPELYGSIEEQKGYKYLIIEPPIDINNEVLTDYI